MADDGEHSDRLPEDLDISGFVGPYRFPDIKRRRIPAVIYLVVAVACLAGWAARGSDAVLVNEGFAVVGVLLLAAGVYHLVAGWPLKIDQTEALAAAGREVAFAVGHASAQLGWLGLRSRPTWRILLYSAEDPPAKRALVLVDGVEGHVVGNMVEDNPEDWTAYK